MTDLYRFTTLEDLADALAPLIAHALGDRNSRSKPANEPNDWPDESSNQDETDPWVDEPPARETRSQTRSAPRERSSSRQSSGRNQVNSRQGSSRSSGGSNPSCARASGWPDSGQETDRFDREWFFGEADAPECHGGHVAARLLGTSKDGKEYEVWACPAGYGKTYKSKCDLWDYVS
jgi:hypothetical protein